MKDQYIQDIKRFNRFYTRVMGLFDLYTDESPYSATEALILFEISNQEKCTAAFLSEHFLLDKGYVSRMLKRFDQEGLIGRITSESDRRIQYINLTKIGEEALMSLAEKASGNVRKMIEGISEEEVKRLIESMQQVENILHPKILTGGDV